MYPSALPRGTIEILCTRLTPGSSSAHSACPASCQATTRRSCSLSVRRDCMPATTRSTALSKSAWTSCRRRARAAKIAASLHRLARSAPASPDGLARDQSRGRRRRASGLVRVWTRMIASRPTTSGGETRIWRSKRPGRSSAGSSFSSRLEAAITTSDAGRVEAVHLDEQLVERLLALGVVVRAALGADRVELVDEDDRGLRLARLGEQAPDARRAQAGEHLDERRGRLREELARRTRRRRPWRAASCRCRADRAGGSPSAPSRPARGSASGSRRNSTTSASSALASSAPATAAHLTDADDSGLICCGFVFGISFSVRQMKTTSRNMKMIGAQVMISGSRLLQLVPVRLGAPSAAPAAPDDTRSSGRGRQLEPSIMPAQYARRHAAGD